jgi:myo-inositol 2-dehydrogenase/D-chiro-inositol 1-dehydrogenase
MLRIGLLGCDPRIAEVATAALGRGDRIVAVHDVSPATLRSLGTPVSIPSWEPLLDAATCAAVLVGADGWSESRAAAVRTLVQAGRPLVLSQPLELSMLWAYELDMIRRDTGSPIVPCLPDRLHPFVARLRERIEAALAGVDAAVESLHLERRMHDRSQAAVLAALSRDADLVRAVAGDPARLSTLGAADAAAAWPTLAVGFTGASQLPVRWQVAPAGEPGLTIRLQAAANSVTVEAPDDASTPWTWNAADTGGGFDRGSAILAVLDAALHRAPTPAADEPLPAATWSDAARAIELAETVPRSLAKGRSIDLHREEFTEIGTFKGTMASLGCGLIMAALVVVIVATLVAGMAREFGWDAAGSLVDAWPMVVLGILALFLGLQIIPLLIGSGDRDDDRPGSARET